MNDWLRVRWTTPEGEERRLRLLAYLRTQIQWWRETGWPAEGDARPDLRGFDLRRERLVGFDLSDTRLDRAQLDGADLFRAQLCRSSLQGASLFGVTAIELDAFAATFYGARLDESTFDHATLVAANLAGTSWRHVSLREADLRGATFNGAEMLGCDFEGALLGWADLDGALVVGARGFPWSRYERDGTDALSPTFAPLLRMHKQLMHGLTPFARKVADGCLLGSPGPAVEVRALLLDDDWRVTLGGIAGAVVLGPVPRVCEALWLALERGSWVAPQLAGAASLLDRQFAEKAAAFIWPGGLGKPAKSLVSVATLLDRTRSLPASLAALPEAESTRQITLRWLDRTAGRTAGPVPNARGV